MKKTLLLAFFLVFQNLLVHADFTGGSVRDSVRASTLSKIRAINQNRLNQFNVIKATNDEKLAVLEAISMILGEPSPANLNPALEIPEDSAVNELASAIVTRFESSPDDFIFASAMDRYKTMNHRIRAYREYLDELNTRSNQVLNITDRQRVKAELGYLESRIKLDRNFLEAATEAEVTGIQNKKSEIRERRLRDDAIDNMLGR